MGLRVDAGDISSTKERVNNKKCLRKSELRNRTDRFCHGRERYQHTSVA